MLVVQQAVGHLDWLTVWIDEVQLKDRRGSIRFGVLLQTMTHPGDLHLIFGDLGPLFGPLTNLPISHTTQPVTASMGRLGGPCSGRLSLLLLLLLRLLL